jgi:hypothetical protein
VAVSVVLPFLAEEKKKATPEPPKPPLERVMEVKPDGTPAADWKAKNMVRAFFDKGQPKRPFGDPEREGERKALVAWVRAGGPKEAYEKDEFPLPADWGDQKISKQFRKGDKLAIKSIISSRCIRCHSKDGEDAKAIERPLETYEDIAKYLK